MLTSLVIKSKCKAHVAKETVKDFMHGKKNGDAQLVVALVLVAVAIGLCVIFRNSINSLMSDLFNKMSGSIADLSAGVAGEAATYNPTNPT